MEHLALIFFLTTVMAIISPAVLNAWKNHDNTLVAVGGMTVLFFSFLVIIAAAADLVQNHLTVSFH